jgi:hypothetical protein
MVERRSHEGGDILHPARFDFTNICCYNNHMETPREEPHIVTTDPFEVRAIVDSLYIMGALDDGDIYEIVKSDGTTEQLQLGGGLQHIADRIIQQIYPGSVVTLLSSGEAT